MNQQRHAEAGRNALRTAIQHGIFQSRIFQSRIFQSLWAALPACLLAPAVLAQQSGTLTPNQQATAQHLNDVCQRLNGASGAEGTHLSNDQFDLLQRCGGVFTEAGVSQAAVDEIGAQQFNALRTVSVQFAQNQYQSVMDRLVALRSGQRRTPLAQTRTTVSEDASDLLANSDLRTLGAGAASDAEERGDLLANRAGFWTRATYGDGAKSNSLADAGFRSDQWGATAGFDYRLGREMVAGVSVGYGESNVSFKPIAQGGFNADAFDASVYGTVYFGGVYVDAIVNYIDTDYATSRRVLYSETPGSLLDRNARANISGRTLNGGISAGYDFVFGAFTLAPVLGYFYVDGDLKGFRERGASGLDLQFADRDFRSSVGSVGFRASYAWRTNVGVFIPQLRATYIHEFADDVETFRARLVNDPSNGTPAQSGPIVFNGGPVDQSYLKFALGMSAQFKYDIAAYVEYQRLQDFRFVSFSDLTFGVRMQRGF
jgi:outer membrane autotransporter protein